MNDVAVKVDLLLQDREGSNAMWCIFPKSSSCDGGLKKKHEFEMEIGRLHNLETLFSLIHQMRKKGNYQATVPCVLV